VPQSTKCCGAPHRAFGERMVASIPGQGDLGYPPSYQVLWSGYTTLGVGTQHNLLALRPLLSISECVGVESPSPCSLCKAANF